MSVPVAHTQLQLTESYTTITLLGYGYLCYSKVILDFNVKAVKLVCTSDRCIFCPLQPMTTTQISIIVIVSTLRLLHI